MIREQRLLKRMRDELGEELNEYISTFYACDLWKIKENVLIMNKTFRRMIDIVADFNLVSSNEIIESTYKLVESNEMMFKIMEFITEDYVKNGSKSLLNRVMVLCYCMYMISQELNITATELLDRVIESDLVRTRTNAWIKIKHFIGINRYPFEFEGDPEAILLISIVKGSPLHETLEYMVEHNALV